MPSFHRRPAPDTTARHPWEVSHAAPEDLAVGLELELIELVRQRSEVAADHGEAARLDGEIEQALGALDDVAGEVSAFLGQVA